MLIRPNKYVLLFALLVFSFMSFNFGIKIEKKRAEKRLYTYEKDVEKHLFDDRWSADLINEELSGTTAGFSVGIAEYSCKEFGKPGIHDDQEGIYILSGHGEYMLGDKIFPVSPGCAIYVPPHTKHAVRRTGDEPVKLLYTHGAVK